MAEAVNAHLPEGLDWTAPEESSASMNTRNEYMEMRYKRAAQIMWLMYETQILGYYGTYSTLLPGHDKHARETFIEDEIPQLKLVLKNGGPRDTTVVEQHRWDAVCTVEIPQVLSSSSWWLATRAAEARAKEEALLRIDAAAAVEYAADQLGAVDGDGDASA